MKGEISYQSLFEIVFLLQTDVFLQERSSFSKFLQL